MSGALPTVKIKTANGPVEINMTDFDPAKGHVLADASDLPELAPLPTVTEIAEVPPVIDTPLVAPTFTIGTNGKRGDALKFVVLDSEGKPLGEKEYDSEEDAQAMIDLLTGNKAAE